MKRIPMPVGLLLGVIFSSAILLRAAPEPPLSPDPWIGQIRNRVAAAADSSRIEAARAITSALTELEENRWQLDPDLALGRSAALVELAEDRRGPEDLVTLAALELKARLANELQRVTEAAAILDQLAQRVSRGPPLPADLAAAIVEDHDVSLLRRGQPERALRGLAMLAQSPFVADNPGWSLWIANLMGEAYLDLSDRDRVAQGHAKELLLGALQAIPRAGESNSLVAAAIYHNVGRFYRYSLDSEAAEKFAGLALTHRRLLLHARHPDLAASKVLFAQADIAGGRYAEGTSLLNEALPVLSATYGPAHNETIFCLQLESMAAHLRGSPIEAGAWARRVLRHQRQLALETLYLGTEVDRRFQLRQTQPFLTAGTVPSLTDSLFAEAAGLFKGALARSQFEDRQLSLARSNLTAKPVAEEWMAKRDTYLDVRKAELMGKAAPALPALEADLTRLERRLEAQGFRLGGIRRLFGNAATPALPNLGQDTAVVDYVVHVQATDDPGAGRQLDALVYLPGRDPRRVPIANQRELPKLVFRYQQALGSNLLTAAELVVVSRRIREIVWDPVHGLLPAGVTNLVLCPDGALSFISFAGLALDDHLLGEEFSFRYAPSLGDLRDAGIKPPVNKNAALFVNPAYDRRPSDGHEKSDQWVRLANTASEGEAVRKVAKARHWEVSLLAQDKVTKEAIRAVHSPGLLLLATHGFWHPTGSPDATTARNSEAVRWAMRSSGLALAAANWTVPSREMGQARDAGAFVTVPVSRPPFEPNPDGHLTAADAAELDLRDTWLVVLSACGTGLGEFGDAEGIYGLQRGFLTAGARNILLTAWPIRDSLSARFIPEVIEEALDSGDLAKSFGRVQGRTMRRLRVENQLPLGEVIRLAAPYLLLTREP